MKRSVNERMSEMISEKKIVYWTRMKHGTWQLHIAATDAGICYIGSNNAAFEEMAEWANRKFTQIEWINDFSFFELDNLIDYLEGRRITIEMPIDLYGTDFQMRVWEQLKAIPYGETVSYAEIAQRLGKPTAVRAVGGAIGANPVLFIIPCHRVIAKNGKLTGFRAGLSMKESLLRLERDFNQNNTRIPLA